MCVYKYFYEPMASHQQLPESHLVIFCAVILYPLFRHTESSRKLHHMSHKYFCLRCTLFNISYSIFCIIFFETLVLTFLFFPYGYIYVYMYILMYPNITWHGMMVLLLSPHVDKGEKAVEKIMLCQAGHHVLYSVGHVLGLFRLIWQTLQEFQIFRADGK